MADSRSVSGSIKVEADGDARVALELMFTVARNENVTKNRRYFLELYSQCREIVRGTEVKYLSVKLPEQ
jgi:hypothetical protein